MDELINYLSGMNAGRNRGRSSSERGGTHQPQVRREVLFLLSGVSTRGGLAALPEVLRGSCSTAGLQRKHYRFLRYPSFSSERKDACPPTDIYRLIKIIGWLTSCPETLRSDELPLSHDNTTRKKGFDIA